MSNAIQVTNLSKKYTIQHSLRDSSDSLKQAVASQLNRIIRKGPRMLWDNLSTSTEDIWALKDIDFSIQQGDRVGIIGRNGAGKSTFLKVLSRITSPTTGSVRINGRVTSLLEVGTGFHPELTGRENIYLNGAILGMRRDEINRRFDEIVSFSELEKFLDTPVKRYSSGMLMRLAFAVAAHLDSDIMIIDEVLAVGDLQFQEKCLKKIGEFNSQGRTLLFVSHNINTVLSLCNKAIFLEKGKLVSYDSAHHCVDLYLSRFDQRKQSLWEGEAGNRQFKVTRAQTLQTREEQDLSFFFQDEDVSVEVTYEVDVPSHYPLVIQWGLHDQSGLILGTSRLTKDHKAHQQVACVGEGQLRFNFPSGMLYPGTYQLRLHVFSAERDIIPDNEIVLPLRICSRNRDVALNNDIDGIYLGNSWSV